MFKKRTCKKCGKKLEKDYNFCPNCGTNLNNKKDWGVLGRNDNPESIDSFANIGGGILGKMINSTMKMIEKEMENTNKNDRDKIPSNFKLMINGKEVNFGEKPEKPKEKKQEKTFFTKEQSKRYSELGKSEPKTNLRRLGDKLVYEIEMPELKSLKDVLINKLEKSIEIKAIGKKKAYYKLIPFSMPISKKYVEKGKLVLEMNDK